MKKLLRRVLLLAVLVLILTAIFGTAALADDGTAAEVVDTGTGLGDVLDMISVIIMLAILVESIAELIKAAISPARWPKWVWLIITSAMGIAICILWTVNLFTAVGLAGVGAAIIAGQVITGIAIGAGSGFVHTLLDKMMSTKNFNNSVQAIEGVIEKDPPDGG